MSTTPDDGGATSPPSGNSFLGDVCVNGQRWTRKTLRNPSRPILEVALGVFALLMFTSVFGDVGELALDRGGFGDVGYVTFILPAVVVQVSMASALSSGMGLVADLDSGMFEKTVASPMSWTAVFTGKALSELLRIACHVLVVLGIGIAMGATVETGLLGVLGVVTVCLLVGLWFMALSNVIALVTRDQEALDAAGNLLLFPLLFLSSGFLPVESLPETVQTIATANPITYAIDAVRSLLLGRDVLTVVEVSWTGGIGDTLGPALLVLLGLNLVFGATAVGLLGRASSAAVA